jgi:hypothetical protein
VTYVDKIFNDLRSKYDCIVGVHIRRDDYKTFLNGIYFHSWKAYLNWTIETKLLLENNGKRKVGFLFCSDDEIPFSLFKNYSVSILGNNEPMVDIYALSLCDFNIGPPSSFGTWVSWYGKVPRLQLKKGLKIASLEQFSICHNC